MNRQPRCANGQVSTTLRLLKRMNGNRWEKAHNSFSAWGGNKIKRKLGYASVILLLLVTLFFYLGEYKLNALSAARANSFVPKDSVLLDKVDYPWGKVFIFDSSEKPITAISFKSFGFLWVSRMSTYYFHNDDPIKTIGGITYSDDKGRAATVFSVLLNERKQS
ncbi:hypothetical protein [Paenibacillus guangzhouensis]|uniref:hypothetical protein n=1 Tax=Paenibacillus guangzhouensis TaxID=1473112 RepID=UPI00187B7E8B|nr:hypothetical protein [Paenibacillus guangzhouensis]